VNFGYKKFGTDYFGNPGASAACNVNVVCPEAVGWENERNSVALIVVNGQESCTGSLVMNTCNTNRPYFLTANHCLSGNVANRVFQFQTWSNTCIGNNGWREDVHFNGATLRANNAASDFALLELNQTPPANSGITYSGWNRNINVPNGSVGIHHPAGDLMKFSRDLDPSGVSSWGGTNNHWVSVFEQGTVQPGSSGSPLYDMNHRIVGQLHGDQQNQGNYCAQRRGEYGKFDQSWIGGGTNTTRLSNWLDPTNTGVLITNTTDVANLISIRPADYVISGPAQFCTSGNYSINNLPAGATLQWLVTPIYGQQSQSVSNNVLTLTRVTDGSASI
jgi:V8-like Glu-specific endopeptidase